MRYVIVVWTKIQRRCDGTLKDAYLRTERLLQR